MNTRPTPETDDATLIANDIEHGGNFNAVHVQVSKRLERERDEARAEMAAIKAMLLDPVEVELDMIRGNIAIPARPEFGGVYEAAWAVVREELTQSYAKLDRILNLTIHDDTFWAIEEIARISGGESDSFPNAESTRAENKP